MLRHAIVGTGFGLKVHYPSFSANKDINVVSICNNSVLDLPNNTSPINVYSNWLEMLHTEKLDSISIATPPYSHKEIVSEAISRGINVYCEKPFGISVEEAKLMTSLAKKNKVHGIIGFQYRYQNGLKEMKKFINSGQLGNLHSINIDWITSGRADPARPWSWQHSNKHGGGVINGFLIHMIDLIPWMSGLSFKEIYAHSSILIKERPYKDNFREVTAEDYVDLNATLSQNVKASIKISNTIKNGTGLKIIVSGEKGTLNFYHSWPFTDEQASLIFNKDNTRIDLLSNKKKDDSLFLSVKALIDDYVSLMLDNYSGDSLPLFTDGLNARQLIDSIYNISNTGKSIKI